VPVDLAGSALGPALEAAGHDPARTTTWIWEGVVPYLTRPQVEATVDDVSARSATGSRLVVTYQAPSLVATLGRTLSRVLSALARRTDPLGREPWRSAWTPAAIRSLLAAQGWDVGSDDDMLALAQQLGTPVHHRRSLRTGRLAVADRA
jgi:methyltransferase (TIGR00027 family)